MKKKNQRSLIFEKNIISPYSHVDKTFLYEYPFAINPISVFCSHTYTQVLLQHVKRNTVMLPRTDQNHKINYKSHIHQFINNRFIRIIVLSIVTVGAGVAAGEGRGSSRGPERAGPLSAEHRAAPKTRG